jgi:peptide/nickel transport system permease protein
VEADVVALSAAIGRPSCRLPSWHWSMFSCFISEWIAPHDLHTRHVKYIFAPPQGIHFIHEGKFLGPFVYGFKMERDLDTLQRVYTEDTTKPQPLRFFCSGESYEFWGW